MHTARHPATPLESLLRVNWIYVRSAAWCAVMDSFLFGGQDEEPSVPDSVLKNLLLEVSFPASFCLPGVWL